MSLILNIDTATETAQVSIAQEGKILQSLSNTLQKEHATFLHTAVQNLLQSTGIFIADIDAIAVTAGPGSYTGLRVGMASAKGFCYALQKPLITLNTLQVLTLAAQQQIPPTDDILYCPMIDARRMEVFTALYHNNFNPLIAPCAMVLQENSFVNFLASYKIFFFGSGAQKFKSICTKSTAFFISVKNEADAMAQLSYTHYLQKQFADLAYSQPFYLKEFQDKI